VANHFENRIVRPIRVFIRRLTFDGLLSISLGGRTLDELNAAARPMLTLNSPSVVGGTWSLGEGPLLVNKASILFVTEIPELGAPLEKSDAEPELKRFGRSAIRLRLEDYDVEAYVHTTQGGDSLGRLSQASHPFIALNAATVTGPGADMTVPFLAINRVRVLAAQELFSVSAILEEVSAGAADAED
jgi:hypothetical protein